MNNIPPFSAAEIGQRLAQLRGRQTQEDMAKTLSIHPNTLRNYERGERDPDASLLYKIAVEYQVAVEWIVTGRGPRTLQDQERLFAHLEDLLSARLPSELDEEFILVPRYSFHEVSLARRTGEEVRTHQLAFRKNWVTVDMGLDPKQLLATIMAGDSMEPTLRQGDVLLLDHRERERLEDGVYAMEWEETLLVKRIQFLPDGKVALRSDNPLYEPLQASRATILALPFLARLVWVGHRV